MLQTSARLLRLLGLLQTRRDWSGAALAHQLEVDARTVRRDVDRLRALGYRVASSAGTGGGYRLGAGTAMPPLLLSDEETVAVALGLLTSALGSVSGVEEAALGAYAKLEQLVPGRLRGRIAALQEAAVALAPAHGSPVPPELLATLAGACRDTQRVWVEYRDRVGDRGPRVLQPHRLVCTGRRWYLVAWDEGREDWRTFRLDRVLAARATGGRFAPRQLPREVRAFVSESLGSAPYRHRATVRFRCSAEELAERTSPAAGRVEPLDGQSCLLHTGSMSLDALAVHLALKGFDFEVLEPPELAAHLESLGARCLRAVAGPPPRTTRPRRGRGRAPSTAPPAGAPPPARG